MTDLNVDVTDVLGIDAGGTKTSILFESLSALKAGDKDADINSATFGTGNFRQIGLDGIRDLCQRIKEHFNLNTPLTVGVVAGFAGAGTPESWQQIQTVFEDQGFSPEHITITSDAELLLRSLGENGVLLIAGTGSICMGRKGSTAHNDDTLVRAGGYGYRVQSEASGYYLGMRAIDASLKIEDGRKQAATALYQAVIQHFGVDSLKGNIASILYPREANRDSVQEQVAQLAPIVLSAAEDGDAVAKQFVNQAVAELADHIQAVLAELEVQSSVVGLHGGLFKAEHVDELLIGPIAEHEYLEGYNLEFKTVGVKPGDSNPILEVMRSVFC